MDRRQDAHAAGESGLCQRPSRIRPYVWKKSRAPPGSWAQRHVPVGMGGEVIAVALDALDQQGKALPIRHHADLVEANGLFSEPMLHGGEGRRWPGSCHPYGSLGCPHRRCVKHLPVLPPAQAVIEGVHQLPRARSDVSPGHILPAIESVLAQGILCTEGGVSDRGIPSCIETTTAMRLDRGRYQEEVIIGGHRQPASRAGQYLTASDRPRRLILRDRPAPGGPRTHSVCRWGPARSGEANRPDTVCHQAEIPHQLRKALLRDPQVGLGIGSAIHSLRHSQVPVCVFPPCRGFPAC